MIRLRTDLIIVHCSATRADQDIDAKTLDAWHRARGFAMIGYHFVIRRDGRIETGRAVNMVGAHVSGFNSRSVGVCMVGGIDAKGKGENNFTPLQFDSLIEILESLRDQYPKASIRGHRDFSPDLNHDGIISRNEWMKECPSFDVQDWCLMVGLDAQ